MLPATGLPCASRIGGVAANHCERDRRALGGDGAEEGSGVDHVFPRIATHPLRQRDDRPEVGHDSRGMELGRGIDESIAARDADQAEGVQTLQHPLGYIGEGRNGNDSVEHDFHLARIVFYSSTDVNL